MLSLREVIPVAPVLGAHTGASLTGLIIGPLALFADLSETTISTRHDQGMSAGFSGSHALI